MDISYLGVALGLVLLLYPLLIFAHLKIKLSRQLFISISRMILQLSLVGIWLEFLFNQKLWWLTLLWMLVMVLTAIFTIKGRLRFQRKILLPVITTALFTSGIIVMPWVLIMIVKPQPLYDPMYVIPIYGMILGNSMNSCALILERFESGLADNWQAYFTRISLGANLWEAVLPPFRKALHSALLPQLLNTASMGLVSLPGMMTGQILGGASPLVAIKYQMMIMFAIFSAASITDYVAIRLYIVKRFDKFYLPKGER